MRDRTSAPESSKARPSVSARIGAAIGFLESHGEPDPSARFELDGTDLLLTRDACATMLMDLYRRTRESEVFNYLATFVGSLLARRVRARVARCCIPLDSEEILQDTLVNVYRYPDRFDGSRPGAFGAWSSRIIENTIRHHMRKSASGPAVFLRTDDELANEADPLSRDPSLRMDQSEQCKGAAATMTVLLCGYLEAYASLTERERNVLELVEVDGLRYRDVANLLGVRYETIKMIVFRARRRITERLESRLAVAEAVPRRRSRSRTSRAQTATA